MKRIKRLTILFLINILAAVIVMAGYRCIMQEQTIVCAEEMSQEISQGGTQRISQLDSQAVTLENSKSEGNPQADSQRVIQLNSQSDSQISSSQKVIQLNSQSDPQTSSYSSSDAQSQSRNGKSTVSESGNKSSEGNQSSLSNNEVNIDDLDGQTKGQITALYDYINKMKTNVELIQDLNPAEYIESYIKQGKGNISIDAIAKGILSLIFKEVRSVLKLVISIVTIVIICSLLKNLQEAFSNESISQVAFYACYALIIMVLSKSFLISITVAKDVISNVSEFMGALLPILIAMIGAAGGFTQAASLDPIILICVVFIPKLYSKVIIPLILMTFVMEFANNLSTEHKISNLCSLVKQSVIWMQGIIITIFIAMLTIRGISSSTIDAVTLKTAKFAIDNFVPIVGKTFSDAIASVAGYSLIIKNAVSSIGLLVIILLMIYPIIKLVLMAVIYKLAGALVEPICDSRITKSLSSAGGAVTLLISCVLSVSLMFFILIAIMASSGKYVIGG